MEALLLTSGTIFAGTQLYHRFLANARSGPARQPSGAQVAKPTATQASFLVAKQVDKPDRIEQRLDHSLTVAAASAGIAAVSALFFPPLQVVTIPVLLYMSVPATQDAYAELVEDRRVGLGLLETTALAIVFAQSAYLVGSLGFSFYYLGRKWWHQAKQTRTAIACPDPATWHIRVRRANAELDLTVNQLETGDVVLIGSGDVAPIDGQIVEGVAWVMPYATRVQPSPIVKNVHGYLHATDLILAGHVSLLVQ